mmetsp:Transcript_37174/g.119256  ORF Transcript_37174/g.119256 Transcript_37174/m.119256 type:complete len:230 (+) Transcript_37174:132-821(+)
MAGAYKPLAGVVEGESFVHYFYLRRNGERVVFVANVPQLPFQSASEIEGKLRRTFAGVESVELLGSSSSRTVGARVTFGTKAQAEAVLGLTTVKVGLRETKFADAEDALARHVGECEDARDSEARAEEVLGAFEAEKQVDLERRALRREGGADEDGFVTVTYKRKAVNDAPVEKKKRKKKVLEQDNFYKFQKLQAKKQRLDALRAAVEKDKLRIAKVATNRRAKFKPET